ncbi:NAD-dependent epimerase/dehydratase family protein [Leptolyngbya sp. PCC 6406]|uniref:NAD-dependent epimerase/dehydratase family protein n=1 Tax=Leptolyngbya sp. PCC 6406 TaxID=1173264 RepID=UPI0003078C62|nr:NAD(P)-dependent oxidoreductase [Leptolyngbya sp. PCC 6406]
MSDAASVSPKRIFITGGSGCIGHYLVEALLQDTPHELFLLLRNPAKLLLNWQHQPRLHVITGDLRQAQTHAGLLATMDTVVLAATSWGGAQEIYDINVTANLDLMALLDPERCQQVVYFSTASILNQANEPLPEAGALGTDYIRSKYDCYLRLPEQAIAPRITSVFPTLVFGGDKDKPYSHISAGLPEVCKWMWLIRFLQADGSFHFSHGRDIAQVVAHLIDHPPLPGADRRVVIGNPSLRVNDAIAEMTEYLGMRQFFGIPLSAWLADRIIDLFKIEMAPWDRFCIQYRHFIYQNPINPASLGLPTYCPTVSDLLRVSGIPAG